MIMLIKYYSKETSKIKQNDIDADVITYEVDKEDLDIMAANQPAQYEPKTYFLYQESEPNVYTMAVDNIEYGRIIIGGQKDGKYKLNQYIVHSGLNTLLMLLG